MFLQFPHERIGFTSDEWQRMPRGHRTLIRDYYLNGKDVTRTVLYDEYEDHTHLMRVEHLYNLRERPVIHFAVTDLTFY